MKIQKAEEQYHSSQFSQQKKRTSSHPLKQYCKTNFHKNYKIREITQVENNKEIDVNSKQVSQDRPIRDIMDLYHINHFKDSFSQDSQQNSYLKIIKQEETETDQSLDNSLRRSKENRPLNFQSKQSLLKFDSLTKNQKTFRKYSLSFDQIYLSQKNIQIQNVLNEKLDNTPQLKKMKTLADKKTIGQSIKDYSINSVALLATVGAVSYIVTSKVMKGGLTLIKNRFANNQFIN